MRARSIMAAGCALPLGGCAKLALLDPAGPIAAANRTILLNSLAIMLAIVVPTILAAFAFAWWYRASNAKARRLPDWAYSGRIELLVWSIPTLAIIFLGGVIWIGSHRLDPARPVAAKPAPVEVQVVSLDWKWLFILPDQGVASVDELAIPAGVPVRFSITSASVMNSFFVPRLGSMIYAMNGMVTVLNLQADRPGVYRGMSAHYSGDGFSDMDFTVRALPPADHARWVAAAKRSARVLDRGAYDRLAEQGTVKRPIVYGRVDPGLFHGVAMQHIPPAPGPVTGRGGDKGVSPRSVR